jgi:hypothetical protein
MASMMLSIVVMWLDVRFDVPVLEIVKANIAFLSEPIALLPSKVAYKPKVSQSLRDTILILGDRSSLLGDFIFWQNGLDLSLFSNYNL